MHNLKLQRGLPRDIAGVEIARQLLRSGTSVGANVEESDGAESTADKIHKLKVARKEAKESRFWLRTIKEAELLKSAELEVLLAECLELIKILSSMINKLGKLDD